MPNLISVLLISILIYQINITEIESKISRIGDDSSTTSTSIEDSSSISTTFISESSSTFQSTTSGITEGSSSTSTTFISESSSTFQSTIWNNRGFIINKHNFYFRE
jgi:hypothetical protein